MEGKEVSLKKADEEYKLIENIVAKVNSNFATIDFARKADGQLIVMEMGDGQVSGLQNIPASEFYSIFGRI